MAKDFTRHFFYKSTAISTQQKLQIISSKKLETKTKKRKNLKINNAPKWVHRLLSVEEMSL